jgi:type IV secretory pathway protease TraF
MPERCLTSLPEQVSAANMETSQRRPGHILVSATMVGASLLTVSALLHATPLLIWNASASAPLGLYRVVVGPVKRRDFVLAEAPEGARRLAAA